MITGQRRIGKSYILLQIADMIKKEKPEANIVFVDKEQLAFADIRNYMPGSERGTVARHPS